MWNPSATMLAGLSYHSCFFPHFFFEHEPIYAIRVLTELIFITVLQLA